MLWRAPGEQGDVGAFTNANAPTSPCSQKAKQGCCRVPIRRSGQDPALDAAKPIPKPASATQLCSDDQTHHAAIAHLSPFWPRAQRIARKSHTLRPVTRTRKRKQGTEMRSQQCAAFPRCQRERAFVPCPLSGGKRPRQRNARAARTRGDASPRQRHAHGRASYSKNLATPTGMHSRMRPTSSASSKSMP